MSNFLVEHPLEQLPYVYRKMRDMQVTADVNQKQNIKLQASISNLENDNFFDTMSPSALERIEAMCNISVSSSDSLEFRRKRAKNRWNMAQPFSIPFLVQKLNEIIGEGKWEATINKSRTSIVVECFSENQQTYEEIEATMNLLKPVTMLFKNKPLISDGILAKEYVDYANLTYKVRLGSWKLGSMEFGTVNTSTDMIGGNTMTLTEDGITYIAKSVAEGITKVVVNNKFEIIDINIKYQDAIATIEYTVPDSVGSKISSIKLFASDQVEVSSIDLYIPVDGDVRMKHKIAVKEEA